MFSCPEKTADEIKDYSIDWSCALAVGETIFSSTWASAGITIDSSAPTISADGKSTTVWVSGGTPGQTYVITNTIITDNSPARELQESFTLPVVAVQTLNPQGGDCNG